MIRGVQKNRRLLVVSVCISILFYAMFAHTLIAAPDGPVRIVLPLELIAGQPATLAVLASDGHIAPGAKIVLSNGRVITTDESGRAHFLAPPQTGPLFARVLESDVREAADVLPQQQSSGNLQLTHVPTVTSVERPLTIEGSGFDGNADGNSVSISGNRTLVLASSLVQLIIIPPANTAAGPTKLLVTKDGAEATANLTFINIIAISPSDSQIRPGKKTMIHLLVQGTVTPVNLRIQNKTPQTAQFEGEDDVFVRTMGGPDNSVDIRIKGLAAGQFSYSVSCGGDYGQAGTQVTTDFLQAAQKIAGLNAREKIDSILKELQQKVANWEKLANELRSIENSSGSADFQALIRAAERSLNGA